LPNKETNESIINKLIKAGARWLGEVDRVVKLLKKRISGKRIVRKPVLFLQKRVQSEYQLSLTIPHAFVLDLNDNTFSASDLGKIRWNKECSTFFFARYCSSLASICQSLRRLIFCLVCGFPKIIYHSQVGLTALIMLWSQIIYGHCVASILPNMCTIVRFYGTCTAGGTILRG